MATLGYARVSSHRQSLSRQITNIHEAYPGIKIYTDKFTGTRMDRPNFQLLLSILRPQDILVLDSISRLSRSAQSGFDLYMDLYNRGIDIVFLKEPHINTECFRRASQQSIDKVGDDIADIYIEATNKVLMMLARQQIQTAFDQAEKEASDIRQRIREGLRERQATTGLTNGRKKGDKLIIHKQAERVRLIKKHSRDFYGSNTDIEVMKLLDGISSNTYYKYKKIAREQYESERKATLTTTD